MIFKNDLLLYIENEELCLQVLKSFFALVKNQFNKHVKRIRLDNGTMFFNTECNTLIKSLGITNKSSFPHTPLQNGVMDIYHKHILEVAMALRY